MKTLFTNRRRTLLFTKRLDGLFGLLVLAVLIVYPLGTLLLQIVFPHLFDFIPSWKFSFTPFLQVFSDSQNLDSVINSLLLGLISALIATVLGTLTAFTARSMPSTLRKIMELAIWVIFFTPSYVIAEGWLILMQDGGIAAQLFHLQNGWSSWFFTSQGLVIVMGLRYFPFVHFAMTQAIQNISPQLLSAARILGASRWKVFLRVWMPLLAPAWLSGASIAFAEGFGDFGFAAAITPQMQIPLITYQIYSALNQAPVNYSVAAGLSLVVVIVTALALMLQFWWLKKRSYSTINSGSKEVTSPGKRNNGWGLRTLSGLLLLVALGLPVGSTFSASLWKTWSGGISITNWTFAHYSALFAYSGDGFQALLRSGGYALVAAFVTALLALFMAWHMSFRNTSVGKILNVVTMSTMAIPGVVLAVGFVFAWNATWLIPLHLVLYGTYWCLGLAYIAGSLPYAVRLQLGAMSQISPNLLSAAQVLGAKSGVILREIILPLVKTTAISTFLITFTGTLFELPASSLLYPAGQPPFPVLIASKFNAFEWSEGAALTMVGLVIVIGLYGAGSFMLTREKSMTGSEEADTTRTMKETANETMQVAST